jgi:penicillin-binding protein 2
MTSRNDGRQVDPGLSRNRPHGNLLVLRVAVIVAFALLLVRLADWQLVQGAEFAERARENHILQTNTLPTRGLILDRNGESLVENVGVFTATVIPVLLPTLPNGDPDAAARYSIYLQLEAILGVPALEIQTRVTEAEAVLAQDSRIEVAQYLTYEQALRLEEAAADLPGVELTVEPGRRYVGGETFSHILGYIGPMTAEEWSSLQDKGYAFNEPVGKLGVEAFYESELRGDAGFELAEVDAFGNLVSVIETAEAVPGNSLVLSIDAGLQRFVTELLQDELFHPANEATVAAAVVMSPKTGEIYAMVSLPGFDNNIFNQIEDNYDEYQRLLDDPRRPLLNQALSSAAPGSVFKLITASAALQEGNITPATTRNVDSTVWEFVGENGVPTYFRDWAVHGVTDLRRGIARSSNIYFYMASCGILDEGIPGLGDDIDESAVILGYYARQFGLGGLTGIDLVGGESAGTIPSPEWKERVVGDDWFLADTCFMGIGQGDVTATPLQIAGMTAAVANGGAVPQPYLVSQVVAADGTVVTEREPKFDAVPVDADFLQVVREGMRQSVVTEDGAARNARVPGYDIGGKTGTAEFFRNGERLEHAWFTGFAPYDDPEVVVTVYFDLGIGGNKAAPIGGLILDYFLENVLP